MDFYSIAESSPATRPLEKTLYPSFIYNSTDLACKGGDFYAYWDGTVWERDFRKLCRTIDKTLFDKKQELEQKNTESTYRIRTVSNHSSKVMTDFKTFLKQETQSDAAFNNKIVFSEDTPNKKDYATHILNYTPLSGSTEAFDELFGVLYEPEELKKILWFMGALLTGDMHLIQKFLFLYGGKGTGKGTMLKIFKMVFEGYYDHIDLKTLTSTSEFATAEVKEVPLLLDEDCDISSIQNDTNLLKLTAHESVPINGKWVRPYNINFNGLLVAASNERFKVKHVDSGITRRAVVAEPSNNLVESSKYRKLMQAITFEIPYIAQKAIDTYKKEGPGYFDNYVDLQTLQATDHVFSFVKEYREQLGDPCTLKTASVLYKEYLEDIGFETNGYKRKIKQALMKYYNHFEERGNVNGIRIKNIYSDFKDYLFESFVGHVEEDTSWIQFAGSGEIFSTHCQDCPAQYAKPDGTPVNKWSRVTTTLKDIDERNLHWVKVPENHIVIDFDLKTNGQKDLKKNILAASAFPETYAEVSKSGQGLHLHYIYDGDISKLSSLYDTDIEIKQYGKGGSSLRRLLTLCNNEPIRHISTGLPLKEEHDLYDNVKDMVWTEQKIRTSIIRNLRKEYHDATKPSIDFIYKILTDAKEAGLYYDVSDMYQDVTIFATMSTNQAQNCLKVVANMPFVNEPETLDVEDSRVVKNEDLWIFDEEVFPNVNIVCLKKYGKDEYETYFNPTPVEVEGIINRPLIGFNNLKYDNHITYSMLMGKTPADIFAQSQGLINNDRTAKSNNAYELSYLDVFEMSTKKQGLKKWEAELGIKHDELDWPWDQPLPEELWERAAGYCRNDCDATEIVFDHCQDDYNGRLILAELSGLSVNSTTQQHTAQIIFEGDRNAIKQFVKPDLSEEFPGYTFQYSEEEIDDGKGGTKIVRRMKSDYKGIDPSEGGYVFSKPGVYKHVQLDDVESEHPHSLIAVNYFGKYTKNFKALVDARLAIKHKDYDAARKMFNGKLKPYLKDEKSAKGLSYALKIAINIVYGMTSASYPNVFKHPDNIDNVVAKRGALFMIELQHMVQAEGYDVAHIKTDSIKVPDGDDYIKGKISELGDKYGYKFEHEATYSRMALVDKANYIAQYEWHADPEKIGTWEAVGSKFSEPYVFKKLFTKENIQVEDFFMTKSAQTPIYLDDTFVGKVAKVYASKTGFVMTRGERDKGKIAAVTGTKGYRFRLAEEFKGLKDIDMTYYDEMARKALVSINKVGPVHDIIDEIPAEYLDDVTPF